jgi:Flp pilus assembly protein TadG
MLARFNSRQSVCPRPSPRRGVAVVESTLVLFVFLLLLFGIFEYCRFLLVLHVTNNAARDGARYASVRVNTDANLVATVKQDIINYTTARMGGTQKNINGYQVAVYAVDQAGLDQNPPIIRAKPKNAGGPYPDPFNPSDPNAVPWNTVAFTERVAVTIRGTYKPLMPTFLLMPSSIPINITAMMGGES